MLYVTKSLIIGDAIISLILTEVIFIWKFDMFLFKLWKIVLWRVFDICGLCFIQFSFMSCFLHNTEEKPWQF